MDRMLHVEGLRKSYRRGEPILREVSFGLGRGEALAVTGNNGAGKSTLIGILAGTVKPGGGRILFCGEDVASRDGGRRYRASIGYVPQEIALYPELTGLDNLRFFGKANHVEKGKLAEKIQEVGALIGFTEADLKKRVGQYSGGMKRRLNLGAALLHDPALLLLDEPTAGIDEESRRAVLAALKEKREAGTSLIYVGHDREELEFLCTRRGTIMEGEWKEYGTSVECGADGADPEAFQ